LGAVDAKIYDEEGPSQWLLKQTAKEEKSGHQNKKEEEKRGQEEIGYLDNMKTNLKIFESDKKKTLKERTGPISQVQLGGECTQEELGKTLCKIGEETLGGKLWNGEDWGVGLFGKQERRIPRGYWGKGGTRWGGASSLLKV